jgi:Xaa-Pro aminopeptidase
MYDEILRRMDALSIDGLLLKDDSNIRYVSGYTGSDAYVLLQEKGNIFITDARYTEQARLECEGFTVREWKKSDASLEAFIAKNVTELGIRKLGFERSHVSYDFYEKLTGALPDVQCIPTQNIIESLRYIKSTSEVEYIRKAASFADAAFSKILDYIKPGRSEQEVVTELEYYLKKAGSEGIGFPVILVSGKKTSMPHGIPSDKKIGNGDFITIDFGGLYKGYHSDMTRTIAVGKVNDDQKKLYATVKEAQQRGVDALRSGVVGNIPDQKVREVMNRAGYIDHYYPGLGHGLGLDIHEQPFVGIRCNETLQHGCVVTMEPGIYLPDWGGVRIEDTVWVKDTDPEVLTTAPKELIVL